MKIDQHGNRKEKARKQRLRWKLRKELPNEMVSECSTLADYEHRKHIFDRVSHWKIKSRHTEKMKALNFELKASDFFGGIN